MAKSPFVYVPEDKAPSLTAINRRARGLAAERRADLDQKRDVVVKAVDAAFGRKSQKPIVPKGSSMASDLKAKAAAAAKARSNDSKPANAKKD